MENWLEGLGAKGLEDLALADFPVTGRGIQAKKNFKQGERILTIPKAALWTVELAYADPLIGSILHSAQPALSVENIVAVYLLFVRSRDDGYDGQRTHVATIPSSYSSSIFFEDELEVCAGSSLYNITKQLCQQIDDDYRELVVGVFGPHSDLFPLDKFTINDYKWALCTFWSRAMDFQLPNGSSIRLMAPFADMINHSPEVQQCHAYDPRSGSLSILAGKEYKAGDQVYIYYGSIPNNRLLRLYGFVTPKNPHDSYDLILSTHPMAPLYEQKLKLWQLTNLGETPTIPLTLTGPLPNKVLQYLRIQRLNESDFASIASQGNDAAKAAISDSNEVEVLSFLVESISSLLDGFGTQLEKLEKELAEGRYLKAGTHGLRHMSALASKGCFDRPRRKQKAY